MSPRRRIAWQLPTGRSPGTSPSPRILIRPGISASLRRRIRMRRSASTSPRRDPGMPSCGRWRILRWVTRLLATILILSVFGFEIGGLWAVLSTILGLVAIGFVAVWSLISHTSATMLILFLHPFQMGDDLEFPGEPVKGRAVDLNFFFTTLVDHDGTLYQIPNNLFFQKTLKRRKNQRIISLAAQLNSTTPIEVELPPAPPASVATGKVEPPDPMMNYPDPRSIAPPPRR